MTFRFLTGYIVVAAFALAVALTLPDWVRRWVLVPQQAAPAPAAQPEAPLPVPVAPNPTPAAVVPPPAPVAAPPPWVPDWEDAQATPKRYLAWLRTQHPDATITRKWATVSAYCPCTICCDDWAGVGRTAAGADPADRGVAVASARLWRMRRVGEAVHVPGYMNESQPGRAWLPDDTGSAMNRSHARGSFHIDTRYRHHAWAAQQGVRQGWVFIVRSPP